MINNQPNNSDFILYTSSDGEVRVDVFIQNETVWLTQKALQELFGRAKSTISEHISNVFEEGELDENITATNVYNLDVSPTSIGYNQGGNLFFHNVYGVKTNNIQYTTIQYAMIHSNRVYTNSLLNLGMLLNGEAGIYMQNPDYSNINNTNNFITNVNTGITFQASSISYPAGSHLKNLGKVSIATNTVQADYTSIPATGKVVLTAIVADNLFNCKECIADDYKDPILVSRNTIKLAYRGIKSCNWQHQLCYANDNNITLSQEPIGYKNTSTTQYGILHQNNFNDIVNSNVVTGFGIAKTTVYAIKASDNFSQAMLCNSTANTFEGFSFSGAHNTTTWQNNNMQSHKRGMHLNNTIIGEQGSTAGAMDNTWQMPWNSSNFQTFVTSNPSTAAIYSKLFVKIGMLTNPIYNGFAGFSFPYSSASIIITTHKSLYECPKPHKGGGGGTPIAALSLAIKDIITNKVPYSQFIPTKQINGKQSVYKYVNINTSLTTGDSTLQSFMAQTATNNVASLYTAQKSQRKM